MNEKIKKIVKKHIDELNIYCLLSDAPDDEFDCESKHIAEKINEQSSVNDIAYIISKVLTSSFGEKFDPKNERIAETASKIYKDIANI